MARQLLTRKLSNFGGKTTLELAVEAHSKKFVERAACQTLLDSIWWGKMALDTCRIKVSTSHTRHALIQKLSQSICEKKLADRACSVSVMLV